MKQLFLSVCASLAVSAALAAPLETPPDFAWAVRAGGTGHDKTRAIAVDATGHTYIAGEFTGTAEFGETKLTSAGQLDFFVAKLDAKGRFLWARSGGGTGIDRGYGVAVDTEGGVFVTGHFQSTNAVFSGATVMNAGDYDVFIAKYDAAGKLLWIQTAGGAGYDYGHGIAVDARGNCFVTGAVVGSASFGTAVISNAPGSHIFCAKYAPDGKLLWTKTAEGRANNSGHGVAVDGDGNCYVGGYSGGTGSLGGFTLTNATGRDVLVAKLTSEGQVKWLAQGHGSTNAMVHEITADRAGNVWVAGMFKGTVKLGELTATSHGDSDFLIASFGPAGRQQWAHTGGGPGVDYGLGVATDGNGNSFLTGEFTGTAEFGEATLTSRGSTDIYIAKFDRAGNLRWLQQAGGDKGDNAYVIAVDAQGNSYLSGSFGGTAKFGGASVTSAGGNDIYVAKLKAK